MENVPENAVFDRVSSFGLIVLAYVVAIAAALLVVVAHGMDRPLATLVLADLVATLVIFGFSMRLQNGSVYDPYWSIAPPLFALFWLATASPGADGWRQVLVTTLVFAWGIRLTLNWARGWPGLHHEDWRYVNLYAEWKTPQWATSLLGIHLFPTLQVLLGSLALLPALAWEGNSLNAFDVLAWIATAGAILVETVADEQLREFNRTKQPGQILCNGLWAHCRHPNYLGELMFWWGLFLFALAANPNAWWCVIGPLAMTAMFQFASIPMLDQRSIERRPGYAEHMRRLNALVPLYRRGRD